MTVVKVLHVTGTGRSGSTLLTNTLGSMPGVFAAGEIRFVWQRALVGRETCACGNTVDTCPVWAPVMERLGRLAEPMVAAATSRRLRDVTRLRRCGRFFLRRRDLDDDERELVQSIGELYAAISEQTGATVIVDSSKLPTYAALLEEIPTVELYVLHLVRDPRAAAYSWMLGRASHSDEAMDQIGPLKSAMLWTVWNGLTKQRWGNRDRYLRLRYEDVMDEPRSSLIAVAEMVGIDPALLPFVADDKVVLSESHVLAGNPNRRDIGPVQFRADRRWESSLGRRERFTVTAVCAVMLRQMGYRWRVR